MIYWKFKYSRTQRALAVGVSEIYHYGTYNKVCDNMIYQMELINPVKTRIDFRFDSFDNDTYQGLLKLNKVIILHIGAESPLL